MSHLKPGDAAPLFTAPDQHGKPFALESLRGKKVILYFYPKDDTPGCTAESCDLRDNYAVWQAKGFEVVGVSSDGVASHQKFIAKYNLPFTLIADTEKEVHTLYGTWVEKSMYGRKYMGTARETFVIDEAGVLMQVFEKVNTKAHSEQIGSSLNA
ncbi:MAG: thioredoxin-dependent thiol peroxidase [Bacteroidetes bacterium]|nr:thioredoxin-dependent thiol peroxidase [Bacteroidota bacterium]